MQRVSATVNVKREARTHHYAGSGTLRLAVDEDSRGERNREAPRCVCARFVSDGLFMLLWLRLTAHRSHELARLTLRDATSARVRDRPARPFSAQPRQGTKSSPLLSGGQGSVGSPASTGSAILFISRTRSLQVSELTYYRVVEYCSLLLFCGHQPMR